MPLTQPTASLPKPWKEPAPRSNQTQILLVDDDDGVRSIIGLGLETLGYRVRSAGCGKTALEAAAQNKDLQLLVTDVVMPGMSGIELAEKLQETHPGLEVLFISGYLQTTLSPKLPPDSIHFLQKPFSAVQLDKRIKAILSPESGL